jgi:SagB-type dehydrogenase family enzyme
VAAEGRAETAAELLRLLDLGFVVVEGGAGGELDERYARDWSWGGEAAAFHFGIKDADYQGPEAVLAWITHQVASAPSVPLWTANEGLPVTPLPSPDLGHGVIGLMARRRSSRGFDRERAVPLDALSDVLFSGFAILGFADVGVPGASPLPLTTTPSGGGRNPFEAYVVARAVEGLAPGVYHYAGIDGTLGRLAEGAPPLAPLLGNQEWADDAGAVVFLVATFARSSWKYPHPGALRVVYLEAGHIAQNLLLAATAHGLAATPTCAIADAAVEGLLGLDRIGQAALHAVALGARAARPSSADVQSVLPNPYLR